jgi:hypothetical protein
MQYQSDPYAMIKFLKKLFKKDEAQPPKKSKEIEFYFKQELNDCPCIKIEYHDIVLDHLMHKKYLTKTENKLTAEDKKSLGINPRISVTREMIEVLTDEGIRQKDPKDVLSSLYLRATFNKSREDTLEKYKNVGIERFSLMACGDERDCNWCKSMNGVEISVYKDINALIKENCICESHCRCAIQPVSKF